MSAVDLTVEQLAALAIRYQLANLATGRTCCQVSTAVVPLAEKKTSHNTPLLPGRRCNISKSILNAKPARGMSYTWKSILKGINLLNKGIIWRVGNGKSINIWNDPWIPRGISRRVISRKGNNLITHVEELINPVTNTWDLDLLNQSMVGEDVQVILRIPIHEQLDDFPAWHYDKKGLFSVKSAYKVARDCEARESVKGLPECFNPVGTTCGFEWKKLWSLPLPNKILHFLWRVATNSLPLRMKLKQRGINIDTRCPLCFRLNEDGGHIFCKLVKPIWRGLQMEDTRELIARCPSGPSLLQEIFNLNEEKRLTACCLLWIWWAERNKANRGEKPRTSDEIITSVTVHVLEYKNMQVKKLIPSNKMQLQWSRPMHNFLKINVDGAFREQSFSGGWGFIVRNDRGVAVAAGQGHLQEVGNALQAEARALLQAVQITSSMGCNQVILEIDSTILKNAITSSEYDLAPLGVLFREIKAMLCVNFENFRISVVPRSCNVVAHELAARGALLGDGDREVWIGHLPDRKSVV